MELTHTQGKLKLDTKGFCFLCLQEQNDPLQDIKMEPDSNSPLTLFSYQSLLQYLNMDRKKILVNLCGPAESVIILEKELIVQLCSQCNSTTQQFLDLYKQPVINQKDLNSILHKIYDVMANAEEDQTVLEYFKEKMSGNEEDMNHSQVIYNLRRETMEKCLNKIGSSASQSKDLECQVSEFKLSTSSLSANVGQGTLSQLSSPPADVTQCPYCSAMFIGPSNISERKRLQVHLHVHHSDKLFQEYKNPSITPYHFKVCCALLFQNCYESEKGYHCPYCPYIYQRKSSGSVKSLLFPHIMDTHKDALLWRLQDLQRKDQDEMLEMHRDSGGKICEECGDLFYSAKVLNSHVKKYCQVPGIPNKRPKTRKKKEKMCCPKPKLIHDMETEETTYSKHGSRQCPHCPAKIANTRKFGFRYHLLNFHFDKHVTQYKIPSVSTHHFKVCAGLMVQNMDETETHFVCRYCPYSRRRTSKQGKCLVLAHMVDNHEERLIQRLQELQKLDMATLLNCYGGNKGRTCVACGDFFPSHNTWKHHVTYYCLEKDKIKRTRSEGESGTSNKKMKTESFDSEPKPSTRSCMRGAVNERSPSPPPFNDVPQCSYCPAKFPGTHRNRLHLHLYMYHCDQLFKEYKDPTVTPSHFKVCCALLLQNWYSSEKGFHCPYCPYIYQGSNGTLKNFMFPHMMTNHKNELILRLQDLQRKDEVDLLRIHQDSGGKTCEKCGDLLQSSNMLTIHVKNYCLKSRKNKNRIKCGTRVQKSRKCKKKCHPKMLEVMKMEGASGSSDSDNEKTKQHESDSEQEVVETYEEVKIEIKEENEDSN